ncbi:unnamed protein product, partial [Mesorhabditis belari]|uniref:Uncharacterized protein n=1 Tax=Mesorhabditis belari TaxID=2138241 RepID=A0AAF3FFS5_9BILA
MKIQLLLVGVLCWIASVTAKCKLRPFGCYVWDWEEAANTGAEKHAFLTKDWHDKNCKEPPACTKACSLNKKTFDKSDLEGKGIQVACKISDLFCDDAKAKKDNCIASREVEISFPPPPASNPNATTRRREEESQGFEDLFNIRVRRNEMPTTLQPKASQKIKAIVLPVCLIGDALDCKKYSGSAGAICKSDQLNDGALNFKDQKFCTVLESALGGEYPESVIHDTVQYAKVSNIWKSTGLPYALVTSDKANFLPGESKDGKACSTYAARDCRPRPLCEGDSQKVMWKGNKYSLEKFGPTECETACTNANQDLWLEATGEETSLKCRVLDIEGFPLHRRGRKPMAKFMDAKDNLNRTKLFQKAAASRGITDGDITASYPLPIDYSSIKDEAMKKQVEANLWLNKKTNPFAKKYGSHIKTLDVPDCGEDDPDTKICNKKEGQEKRDNKDLAIALLSIALSRRRRPRRRQPLEREEQQLVEKLKTEKGNGQWMCRKRDKRASK